MCKRILFCLLSVSLLLLFACSDFRDMIGGGAKAGKITEPFTSGPYYGKWAVEERLDGEEAKLNPSDCVQFAGGIASFGNAVWEDVTYKIKRVEVSDYMGLKSVSYFALFKDPEAEVVTVCSKGNYLAEFVKIDESSIVLFFDGADLLLDKISDETDILLPPAEEVTAKRSASKSSGALLGLRLPEGDGYAYKTIWIAADQDGLHPPLISDKIFFPRKSGFWDLYIKNVTVGRGGGDVLISNNMAIKPPDNIGCDADYFNDIVVNYVGNDYIAVEKRVANQNVLRLLSVDRLPDHAEIKVSDLMGQEGLDSFNVARRQAIKDRGIRLYEQEDSDKGFGMIRKNGHWILIGRINYQDGKDSVHYDFDGKILPPSSLIFYDSLDPNWHKIRNRVPNALDAFTSPNKDIALVRTKNRLTVYKIGIEQLEDTPLAEFELSEEAVVIMAEWAVGSYVYSWEKAFISYGAVESELI
jgi:hypothetical protein